MIAYSLLAMSMMANPLPLKDGDRIAWIGSAVAEREQQYGHWEAALLLANAEKTLRVRNLAWSGDTVWGEARAAFDTPAKGYERLLKSVKAVKPTVVFVSYGGNESFAGMEKIDAFEKQYEKLLADLAETKARFVLMTPPPMESNAPIKAIRDRNDALAAYSRVIRDIGDRHGHYVADLNRKLSDHASQGNTFTDNGIHFSSAGYESTIPDFLGVLGQRWDGEVPSRYEAVRRAVVAKNELVFHQWRPQNETYLFGFRKHEQGQNAKDIPAFEPLIEQAEADIRKQLKP
jgi:lysophospholipase L1-like esterase